MKRQDIFSISSLLFLVLHVIFPWNYEVLVIHSHPNRLTFRDSSPQTRNGPTGPTNWSIRSNAVALEASSWRHIIFIFSICTVYIVIHKHTYIYLCIEYAHIYVYMYIHMSHSSSSTSVNGWRFNFGGGTSSRFPKILIPSRISAWDSKLLLMEEEILHPFIW